MLDLNNILQSHLTYHIWSIQSTVKWLQTLEDSILTTNISSSFNSINKTIQHVRKAQEFWNQFLNGNPIDSFIWIEELREAQVELNLLLKSTEEFRIIVSKFSDEQLSERIKFNSPWATSNLQRIYYILHVVNHSTYHRGQIVTMARCLNITEGIPMTEYSIFLGNLDQTR